MSPKEIAKLVSKFSGIAIVVINAIIDLVTKITDVIC